MDVFNKYVGQVFDGRYKIKSTVGMGGMAIVFEAIDLFTNRRVAIKMLKENASGNTQAIKRFIIESKAVAMLDHQNIVKIYAISVTGEHKYIVMEFFDGITLREYMKNKGALDWREAVEFTEQVLSALDHAHMRRVIHRDIKPQNIMLLEGGFVKVTDFGIAKIPKAETLTMADKAIGTVFYISPEQAQSKTIDARSDIYSLGVMLYEMVTGKMPFVAETPVAVILKHINTQPVPPTKLNPKIPLGLEQIILCAMEKNPDRRYQSASQMLRHLRRLKQDPTVVFMQRTPPQKTPTSELSINRTTRNPENDYTDGDLDFMRKPLRADDGEEQEERAARRPSNKKSSESSGVPMWVAISIFIAFLALAILGIILIYNSLFDIANPPELPLLRDIFSGFLPL